MALATVGGNTASEGCWHTNVQDQMLHMDQVTSPGLLRAQWPQGPAGIVGRVPAPKSSPALGPDQARARTSALFPKSVALRVGWCSELNPGPCRSGVTPKGGGLGKRPQAHCQHPDSPRPAAATKQPSPRPAPQRPWLPPQLLGDPSLVKVCLTTSPHAAPGAVRWDQLPGAGRRDPGTPHPPPSSPTAHACHRPMRLGSAPGRGCFPLPVPPPMPARRPAPPWQHFPARAEALPGAPVPAPAHSGARLPGSSLALPHARLTVVAHS